MMVSSRQDLPETWYTPFGPIKLSKPMNHHEFDPEAYDARKRTEERAKQLISDRESDKNSYKALYYPPKSNYDDLCPNCGYCPRCGRGGKQNNYPSYPSYPYSQPYTFTAPAQTCGPSTGATLGGALMNTQTASTQSCTAYRGGGAFGGGNSGGG